ncbi:MAG: hypothetical protein ABSF29_13775 [Tepidisphaeraceae bacterium]
MTADHSPNRAAWALSAWAVAARLLCLCIWPMQAYSCDLKDWRIIAGAMLVGINPYVKYQLLNWPPMWMEILFVLGRISDRFDWQMLTCIRVLLVAADVALVLSTWSLARLLNARDRAFTTLLWGLCLNPLLILLTVQQGNFDVIPTILILWFLQSLIRFRRAADPVDWLLAAAFLGLGGFAKTFPLVLTPLLIGEARHLNFKTLSLGLALCFGPAAFSLAPLFVLSPHPVIEFVILYRGTPGNVGVGSLIQWLAGIHAVPLYYPYFTAGLLAAMAYIALRIWRKPLPDDSALVLLAALILIAIFEFGAGYCPQYWMWVAPLLCICFIQQSPAFRRVLIAASLIIVLTNILIFAYDRDLGCFVGLWSNGPFNRRLFDLFCDTQHALILISLPMTAATLILWLYGLRRLQVNWTAPA